jgi:nucleoside 2-deoxyribosyltransferase
MKIYLASPFFNEEQMKVVERLETIIQNKGLDLISPRQSGLILANMTQEDRVKFAAIIFSTNCEDIEKSDAIVAVIDDRDTGTIWEMGYGHARFKPIYSFTNRDYGVNVMLSGCVKGHAKGFDQFERMAEKIATGGDTRDFALHPST